MSAEANAILAVSFYEFANLKANDKSQPQRDASGVAGGSQ